MVLIERVKSFFEGIRDIKHLYKPYKHTNWAREFDLVCNGLYCLTPGLTFGWLV